MAKKVDRDNLEMKSHEEKEQKGWLTNHKLTECPYCGNKMELGFVGLNYNHYSHVSYICPSCGAQSPNFHVDRSLINEVKLNEAITNAVMLMNKKEEK